jgi:hypothetical protein
MVAMPELLTSNAIEAIDILKVDIEGAESDLFAECKSWISKVRLIVIEIHPGLVDYQRVIHSITTHGFRYFPPGSFAPLYDIFLREDVARRVSDTGQPS